MRRYPGRLTAKQKQTLLYLIGFALTHLYQPTVREIAKHSDVTNTAIDQRLLGVAKKGWIRKVPGSQRSWEISDEALLLFERAEMAEIHGPRKWRESA